MTRSYLSVVLVLLVSNLAWSQAPAYSASQIVNASDYAPGPFAPNSVLCVFGANLSWSTRALVSSDIAANALPTSLVSVQVYVDNYPAPLLYVSPNQINFLIPGNQIAGPVPIRVVREGVTGPDAIVTLASAAPALFALADGYVIATHADGTLMTVDAPAQAGETIVLYATGLGRTQPNPSPGTIPQTAASILELNNLTVSLNGVPLEAFRIKYAGVTPLSIGLYQINIELPPTVAVNPTIVVSVGSQSSPAALQLALQ